jgi:hypothetical protein
MVATFSTASCDDHHFWFSSKQKFLRKTLTLTNQFFFWWRKFASLKKKVCSNMVKAIFFNFPKNSPHFEGKKLWNCQHFWRIWAYILAFLF